jgi:predicted MPP superfamily phosphohydrolase
MIVLMIAFTLTVYGLINVYVGSRILLWLKLVCPIVPGWLFWLIYGFLALSMFIGYSIPVSSVAKIIHQISNFWLGIFLYLLLTIIFVDGIRLLLKPTAIGKGLSSLPHLLNWTGFLVLAAAAGCVLYGLYAAKDVQIKKYDLTIHKQAQSLEALDVVLISDIHLGYTTGSKSIQKLVQQINDLDADLICIAGDLFDNNLSSIDSLDEIIQQFSRLKATFGVYACLGNHDVERPVKIKNHIAKDGGKANNGEQAMDANAAMLDFYKKAGITLLQDEAVLVNDAFYVAGRLDAAPIGIPNHTRKSAEEIVSGLDKSKPIFVLDHQPTEFSQIAASGADLLLCGHTHRGQIFPGNIVTKHIYEVDYGYKQKGVLHTIVTSGAGTWGPPMRIGTQSEVVHIHISFN